MVRITFGYPKQTIATVRECAIKAMARTQRENFTFERTHVISIGLVASSW